MTRCFSALAELLVINFVHYLTDEWELNGSDVKRDQNLETEARALRPRPRPELWGQGRGRGQFLDIEARPRPKIKLWIKKYHFGLEDLTSLLNSNTTSTWNWFNSLYLLVLLVSVDENRRSVSHPLCNSTGLWSQETQMPNLLNIFTLVALKPFQFFDFHIP